MFKVHQSIADQSALTLMLFNLQDDASVRDLPKLGTQIPLCPQIFMWLILPLNLIWCSFLTVACLPKECNGFKNPQISQSLTRQKSAVISQDIPIRLLDQKAKQMRGTRNDVIMTLLSLSLKQYLAEHTEDKKTECI